LNVSKNARKVWPAGVSGGVIWENVMKIVPVIKSGDLERSVLFYTRILDFERKWPGHEDREMAQLIHRPLSASRRTRLLIVVY
jgi:hypothetical protein